MKSAIRELEGVIQREREFNAAGRAINTEYLVNIIRSFLMTKEQSEHAKLVPVICSLMKFQPNETKQITEKWSLNNRGLMGWLLPAPPPMTQNIGKSSTDDGNAQTNNYSVYKDGIGGLDIY